MELSSAERFKYYFRSVDYIEVQQVPKDALLIRGGLGFGQNQSHPRLGLDSCADHYKSWKIATLEKYRFGDLFESFYRLRFCSNVELFSSIKRKRIKG